MPFIQLNDEQFPLRTGDVRVGTGADADIRLPGPGGPEALAVLTLAEDNTVVVRRGSEQAVVKVNGVQLGAEPSPLLHGDKLEVAGTELTFGDDRKGGSTQYISAMSIPQELLAPAKVNKPTTGTGGRLVSLVDGREYRITHNGLMIGRDPGCDVVVPSSEVSRRHAEIVPRADGYVISDMSTNGVLVNGERIQQMRVLGRADVIKVANEEFRFYADVAATAPEPPAPTVPSTPAVGAAPAPATPPAADRRPQPEPAPPAAAPRVAPPSAPPAMASGASASPGMPHGAGGTAVIAPMARPGGPAARPQPAAAVAAGLAPQGAPADPGAPALAALEVLSGVLKGRRFEVRRSTALVGRGAHNDVQITDDSVSDSHARLERRESGWMVVDLNSTNGTYAAGRRISGEASLLGVSEVRFGGVKLRFSTADAAAGAAAPAHAPAAAPTPPAADAADAPAGRGRSPAVWVTVAILVGLAAYFFLGR
jgi:pSer/pThr/pTyr-binding forkhead associated (FHA) protein